MKFSTEQSNCIVCGSDKKRVLLNLDFLKQFENALHLVRCALCNFEYIGTHPGKNPLKNIYGQTYFENGYLRFEQNRILQASVYVEIIRNLSVQETPAKLNVLDIGTGLGYFLMLLAKSHYRIHGVESSDFARTYAKEKFNLNIEERMEDLPDIKYDFITLWDVLGHVEDPTSCINYCSSHLKEAGYLIIKFPNFCSNRHKFNFLLAKYRHINSIHAPTVIWRFSRSSIQQFLERFGFRIEKVETVGQPLLRICNALGWKLKTVRFVTGAIDVLTNNRQEIIAYARNSTNVTTI